MSDLDKLKTWISTMNGLGLDLGAAGHSLKALSDVLNPKPKIVTAAPPTSGKIKLADIQAALGDAPPALDAYFAGGPYVPNTEPESEKLTAYEVALANGYQGNKAQWMASMYGGSVTGKMKSDGPNLQHLPNDDPDLAKLKAYAVHDSVLIEHGPPKYGTSVLEDLFLYGTDPGAGDEQQAEMKYLKSKPSPVGFFQVHLDSVPTEWTYWKHEPATSSFGHPKDHSSGPDGDHDKGHHEYTPVKVKHQPGTASTRYLMPLEGEEPGWQKLPFHHWELMADGRIYAVYGKQDGPRRRLPDQNAEALRELVMTGDVLEYAP